MPTCVQTVLASRLRLFSYCDAGLDVNSYIVKDAALFAKAPRSIADIFAFMASQPRVPRPAPRKGAAKAKPAPAAAANPAAAAPKPPLAAAPAPAPAAPAPATPSPGAAAPAPGAMPAPQWHDPLDVCTIRSAGLASVNGAKFGMVRNGGTKAHQGIDLIAVPGTRIYAVADGRAVAVPQANGNAYGNTLVLKVGIDDLPDFQRTKVLASMPNATFVYFYYAHLNEMIDGLPFRNVQAGDIIGKTGNSGNATNMVTVASGAHLHFEVRKVAAIPKTPGQPLINRVNPLPYIVNCTNA
ncbi:M23 family metallopeptidase [Massilia sp. PAMC28688]|uniref:M23 family metallopeptidase n=1 Tax=Massilia sp. PAMC28688 TaxID=2861283 RepID=UPI001E5DEA2E|nr:M23 family metallopeptidase [Massilia sp. PAMC28688]